MKQRRERETLRLEAVLLNLIVSVIVLAVLPDTSFAQSVLSKAIRTSESMEPALSHPEQGRAAQQKLDALRAKTGRRPNIVWLLIDDMGYGDPGTFGGGVTIGAATPNMDRPALFAANLYPDSLRYSDRPVARPDRPNAADSRR